MTNSPALRACVGFLAAALAVVTFHQGMIELLHIADLPGLGVGSAWGMGGVPPYGVPRLFDLCFWGGLYGIVFGLLEPRLPRPLWVAGIVMGVIAVLVGYFVVAPIKGQPIGGGWAWQNWTRSLLINGAWGLGLGLIYPLLPPRRARLTWRDA